MDRASSSSQIPIVPESPNNRPFRQSPHRPSRNAQSALDRARMLSLFALLTAAPSAVGQCVVGSTSSDGCNRYAATSGSASIASPSSYAFPDGRQQLRNYIDAAFGPLALIRSSIAAGVDQSKPAPPEWDAGVQGYGERYGSRFGMFLVDETARYGLGAVMHEDVAYHRCACVGFAPRSAHAFVSAFTARTRSGASVPSLPALVAPYAGAFTAVNAWYPARYEPMDAARLGSMAFTLQTGGNMLREFLPRRH